MKTHDLSHFARLALDAVHREYPYHLSHTFFESESLSEPRDLTPAFYGAYDWHSSVHGHWVLARVLRRAPDSEIAPACRAALDQTLCPEKLSREHAYVARRPGFERPYGLAWLLTLAAELHTHEDPASPAWRRAIRPLEKVAAEHLATWLPKLTHPTRCGTHSQTAFSMALAWDWAGCVGDESLASLLRERAETFFGADRDYALHLEPSGEDFLSPSLGAAWLMARVYSTDRFLTWLDRVMPELNRSFVFQPVTSGDPSDGRLAHLDGLNLSRAWMLHALIASLPDGDPRRDPLAAMAEAHERAGMESLSGEHYAGAHWLGTFGLYLVDRPT